MSEAVTRIEGATQVSVRDDLGHINLRGDSTDKEFVTKVEQVIGQPLPIEANTLTMGPHQVFWLGPDEWLITTGADEVDTLIARLSEAMTALHAGVNDISGGQVTFMLEGRGARTLLAKGCTLDLHASAFSAGRCAQSGLAKATVLLACLDESPTFAIIVRRSFSDYLSRWLHRSSQS